MAAALNPLKILAYFNTALTFSSDAFLPFDPGWFRDFFTGPALDFVRFSRDGETTIAEARFVEQALALSPGDRVLDVPCGGGRMALELASRGLDVTGVDFSVELLETARRGASNREVSVAWEQRDMRDLPWVGEFDAVLCWWNSFGYFDDDGNVAFLRGVFRALKPGGRFLLDTPLAETSLPGMDPQERTWYPAGDVVALEERDYDHETGRLESDWTFIRDGELAKGWFSLRLYTYRELAALLREAGFGALRSYGSLEGEPFEVGAPWLYLVAEKPPA